MKGNNLRWCCSKANGLKLTEVNKNLAAVYLRKSQSALSALRKMREIQEPEWILETSYYAKYFAVYAAFMRCGITSEIHDCTISGFDKLMKAPRELSSELARSRDLRVSAVHYNKEIGAEEVSLHADTAPMFCLAVEEFLRQLTEEEVTAIRKRLRETAHSSTRKQEMKH